MKTLKSDRPLLLIDDSEDIRDVFQIWVEMEGYSVKCVGSPKKALEWLRGGLKPCLVLVDLNMPEMSGTEFVETAHSENLLEDSPVYIFSAQSLVKNIPGTEGWVKKPIDLDQVLKILRSINPPCAPHVESN